MRSLDLALEYSSFSHGAETRLVESIEGLKELSMVLIRPNSFIIAREILTKAGSGLERLTLEVRCDTLCAFVSCFLL